MTAPLKSNDPCWCGSGRKYKRCHQARQERVLPGLVSPLRPVPAGIARPDYAASGRPVTVDESMVKSPEVIERMRVAGRLAAEVLRVTGDAVRVGITTDELDAICHAATVERGAYPSPLNYQGYPKSLCTSVNEVICHGIPDSRPLADGDIVNLDVTVYVDGVHGDTNATFAVGNVDAECLVGNGDEVDAAVDFAAEVEGDGGSEFSGGIGSEVDRELVGGIFLG